MELRDAKVWPLDRPNPEAGATRHADTARPTTLTGDQIRDSFGAPSAIPIWESARLHRAARRGRASRPEHRVWLQMELALPLLLAAMVLVGAGFTMRPVRRGGTGRWSCSPCCRLRHLLHPQLRAGPRRERPDPRGCSPPGRRPSRRSCWRSGCCCTWRTDDRRVPAALPAARGLPAAPLPAGAARRRAPPRRCWPTAWNSTARPAGRRGPRRGRLQGDVRITAERIAYDRAADRLTIDRADHHHRGRRACIRASPTPPSCRPTCATACCAAAPRARPQAPARRYQINRVSGRYTQLYKVPSLVLRGLRGQSPPLWQIRARRVIHDSRSGSSISTMRSSGSSGVPVFYLPAAAPARPDARARAGFLLPVLGHLDLGTGVKACPISSPRRSPRPDGDALRLDHRAARWSCATARRSGAATCASTARCRAMTRAPGETRGLSLRARGLRFAGDFKLAFDLEPDATRPTLSITAIRTRTGSTARSRSRTRRDSYSFARAGALQHAARGRSGRRRPSLIADFEHERRLPENAGHSAAPARRAARHAQDLRWPSTGPDPTASSTGATWPRLEAEIGWRRSCLAGRRAARARQAGAAADQFRHADDSGNRAPTARRDHPHGRDRPCAGPGPVRPRRAYHVSSRWCSSAGRAARPDRRPMTRAAAQVEFDEGNLLSLSRFPAADRRERGAARLSAWLHAHDARRLVPQPDRRAGAGDARSVRRVRRLGAIGLRSDWLVAGSPRGRAVSLDGARSRRRSRGPRPRPAQLPAETDRLAGTYTLARAAPDEDRPNERRSEWRSTGDLQVNERHWSAAADVAYDLARDAPPKPDLRAEYQNNA